MANYQFLAERPVRDDLSFGHKEILDTLQSIVSTCETPFTIGLFGKWGSGKSSIAEGVRDRLIEPGIPVVLFDVWKHEGDALRRTFLLEIDRQLKNLPYGRTFLKNPNRPLSDRLTGNQEMTSTRTMVLDSKHVWRFGIVGLIVLAVFVGASLITYRNFPDAFGAVFNGVSMSFS